MLKLPSQLDLKNPKSHALDEIFRSDKTCRKLFGAVVAAATDVDPLFTNNIDELDDSTADKIEAILKRIKAELEAIKKLQSAADKFQPYALKLSKADPSKVAGVATLRGLQKLQAIIDEMTAKLLEAQERLNMIRIGFKTLDTLTLDDLLDNPKAFKHFQRFAKDESADTAVNYLQRYARDPTPVTLKAAKERHAEMVAANISSGINKEITEAIELFRELGFSESDKIEPQLQEFTAEDLGSDPSTLWNDWQRTWKDGYKTIVTLVKTNTYGRFFESKFAQDLAAELSL